MRFAVRLSLPDRRGTLSAVASAIGRAGGNILSLDVVGSVDGLAIDDVTVQADADCDSLRAAIEGVPSVVVEAIMQTEGLRDQTAPLELATRMLDAGSGAVKILVEGLPEAMWASWTVVVANTHMGPEIIQSAGQVPSTDGLETPWMPLDHLRRLNRAPWMPPAWRHHVDLEIVAVPLAQRNTAVLVARPHGPKFLDTEVSQFDRLAKIAVRSEMLGAGNGNHRY